MKCEQIVKLKSGKEMRFESIRDLDQFIKNNPYEFDLKEFKGAVYDLASDNLEKLKELSKNSDKNEEGKISALEFIKNSKSLDGKQLIPIIDEEKYKDKFISQKELDIKAENRELSDAEIKTRAEDMWENERRDNELSKTSGGIVHSYIKSYLKDPNIAIAKINTELKDIPGSKIIIPKIINELKQLSDRIHQLGTPLVNLDINSKETYTNKKGESKEYDNYRIKDKIDVVVVGKDGKIHLFNINLSKKTYEKWNSAKLLSIDYELGLFRQLLGKKGFNTANMTLNVIPVSADLLGSEGRLDYNTFSIGEIKNRNSDSKSLDFSTGKVSKNLHYIIPYNLTNTVLQLDNGKLKNISDQLGNIFGDGYKYEYTLDYFIKTKLKRDAEGNWYYHNDNLKTKDNSVTIRSLGTSELTFEQKKELLKDNKEVENYLKEKDYKVVDLISSITNAITFSKINNKPIDISDVIIPNKGFKNNPGEVANVKGLFNKYISQKWNILDLDILKKFGITAFYKDGVVDFIGFTGRSLDNNIIKLEKGRTTVLGKFKSDEDSRSLNSLILPSTSENNEVIRIATILNNYPEIFNTSGINLKLGKISVLGTMNYEIKSPNISQVMDNYDILSKLLKIDNNFNKNIKIASEVDKSMPELLNIALVDPESKISNIIDPKKLEVLTSTIGNDKYTIEQKYNYLLKLENDFIKQYPDVVDMKADSSSPEYHVYHLISIMKMEYGKLHMYSEPDLKQFALNGLWMTNPDHVPSSIAREVGKLMTDTFDKLSKIFIPESNKITGLTKRYYEDSGFTTTEQFTIDNTYRLYKDFYVQDGDKISNEFKFVNPYKSKVLDPIKKEYLKSALWELNKYRLVKEGEDFTSDEVEQYRKLSEKDAMKIGKLNDLQLLDEYYLAPIMQTDSLNKLVQKGASEFIKTIGKELKNSYNNLKDNLNTYGEVRKNIDSGSKLEYTSRYNITDAQRKEIIAHYGVGSFNWNVEQLILHYSLDALKTEEIGKTLKTVNNVLWELDYNRRMFGVDNENTGKYIDYLRTSLLLEKTIDTKETANVRKVTTALKFGTSISVLALSPLALVRDLTIGVWGTLSRSMVNFYGKETFGIKNYTNALGMMIADDTKAFSRNTTLIEALNHTYGLGEFDPTKWIERMKTDRQGLFSFFSRWMFWTSSAGYYHSRMVMFLAQMDKDGTIGAHTTDKDGNLVYDFKKDKRFEVYNKGLKNHADYGFQEALYNAKLKVFNEEEGYNLKEGDNLPRAYTQKEKNSLASFSDTAFGYYSEKTKSLLSKHAVGSLWFQFHAYWSGMVRLWFEKPNANKSIEGYFAHAKDVNGNLIYLKYTPREDGTFDVDHTSENTGKPLIMWHGKMAEGIMYSYYNTIKDLLGGELDKSLSNEKRMENLKLGAMDVLASAFLIGVLGGTFTAWKKDRDKENEPFMEHMALNARDWAAAGLTVVGHDSNPTALWSGFSFVPPAFSNAQKQLSAFSSLVGGHKTFAQYLEKTIPATRIVL